MSQAEIIRTYIEWSAAGEIVSSEDLANAFPEYSVDAIHKFLHAPRIQKYLVENHELLPPPRSKSKRTLTDKQRAWLRIITNPYSVHSVPGMIAKANEERGYKWMTLDTHRRWMKQGAFLDAYQKMIAREVKGTKGEMVRRTATKAMQGDQKAIELYHRMAGEPLPTGLEPQGSGGVSIDRVMQVFQILLSPEQLTQAAFLLTNPDAQLELPAAAEPEDDDESYTHTEGPGPGDKL